MDPQLRIKQKAKELFLRYGIRSVSMDEIAAQLGVSKKTIYQLFTDKDALVDAVMADEIIGMQREYLRTVEMARDAVHEIFLTLALFLEQFRNMNPVVLHDMEKFHDRAFRRIQQHKYEFLLKVIEANIEKGIREGLYRPEVNVDVLARFRLESVMLTFNIDLYPPKKYPLADISREVIEYLVYGLATPKGHKLIEKYKSDLLINH